VLAKKGNYSLLLLDGKWIGWLAVHLRPSDVHERILAGELVNLPSGISIHSAETRIDDIARGLHLDFSKKLHSEVRKVAGPDLQQGNVFELREKIAIEMLFIVPTLGFSYEGLDLPFDPPLVVLADCLDWL
jgi:hypothetical protein